MTLLIELGLVIGIVSGLIGIYWFLESRKPPIFQRRWVVFLGIIAGMLLIAYVLTTNLFPPSPRSGVGVTPTPCASTSSSPTSSITDDWSSGRIDATKWRNWGYPQTSVVNHQLKITSTLDKKDYGLDSGAREATQDLTCSYVTNELISTGNQSLHTWEAYPIMILVAHSATDRILFYVTYNLVVARVHIGTENQDIHKPYHPATDKYFGVRENGGTLYFATSANGRDWTNFTSRKDPFDITQVVVGMEAGIWGKESSTTSATFANFNMMPFT